MKRLLSKSFFLLLLVATLFTLFTACGKDSIVGRWSNTDEDGMVYVWEFRADKTAERVFYLDGEEILRESGFTYTDDGQTIHLFSEELGIREQFTYVFDGSSLLITENDVVTEFRPLD